MVAEVTGYWCERSPDMVIVGSIWLFVLGIKRISFDTFFVGTVGALHCRFGLSAPLPPVALAPFPVVVVF